MTQPRQAGGKRRPQERANAPAPAADENRTTATAPDKARAEGRKETPSAEPAQGASGNRAERSTDEAEGTDEKAATAHPHRETKRSEAPPANRRRSGGRRAGSAPEGQEGTPTPAPQGRSRRGRTRDGPQRGRAQGGDPPARSAQRGGREATGPCRPDAAKGTKREKPHGPARGAKRSEAQQKPRRAGVRGPRPRQQTGILFVESHQPVHGPCAMEGAGPHTEPLRIGA